MELTHAWSDAVLAMAGIFVFFRNLMPLPPTSRWLWSAFVLPISVAAAFGCVRFLGIPEARPISEVFQHLAGTVGALSLVTATYVSMPGNKLSKSTIISIIGLGLFLFTFGEISQQRSVAQITSMIAIVLTLALSFYGYLQGQKSESTWLIIGICFLIAGSFNKLIAAQLGLDSVNLYHYLLTASLLSIGKSRSFI